LRGTETLWLVVALNPKKISDEGIISAMENEQKGF
jgi:hypothetical protein